MKMCGLSPLASFYVESHISDGFCATLWRSVNPYSDRRGSNYVGARTGTR